MPVCVQWGIALCSKVKPWLSPMCPRDIVVMWEPWQTLLINSTSNLKHCSHLHDHWFISICSCAEHGNCWEELCFPYHSPSSTFLPHWEDIWSPTRPALCIPAPHPPSILFAPLPRCAGLLRKQRFLVIIHWLAVSVRHLFRLMLHTAWSRAAQGS